MPIEFAVAELPAAAMRGDQHRGFAHTLGEIKVAEELYAVVLGERDVRLYCDFVLDRHRASPHSSGDYTAQARRGDIVGNERGAIG